MAHWIVKLQSRDGRTLYWEVSAADQEAARAVALRQVSERFTTPYTVVEEPKLSFLKERE